MGHVDTNLLFSFILGLLGIIISVVIWAASTHAARVQAREARLSREALVDIETLNQIKKVYESAITQLEDEVSRLRVQARTFEERALTLDRELAALKKFIAENGHPDPPPEVIEIAEKGEDK